jgi:hypothetical protein
MGLAASLGRLGDDAGKNHAVFQEVFARATDRRVLHGYSLEEGIALANQLSKSGMAADNVIGGEEQVFRYQRMTDADRGTLAQAVGLAGRYRGNENVLGYAYGGVKESGMQHGQYQEYLNATLRIFEEGLSKGVVKGFAEITRAQNMLAMIGDTWKGEQGAQRILQMEDAITGANGLQSDYDVIMYRAAQKQAEATGQGTDHLTISKILEQGVSGNPDILKYVHEIMKGITENGENRESGIMMYEKAFSLKTSAAEELWDALAGGKLDAAKAVFEDPSSQGVDDTPEGKLLSATQGIRKDLAQIGSNVIDAKAGIVDSISKLTGILAGNKAFASSAVKTMDVLSDIGVTGESQRKIDKAFEKAYTVEDQPDEDNSGYGDYAERAKKIQEALQGLPVGIQYYMAMKPDNLVNRNLNKFTKAEDFTAENTRLTIEGIDYVKEYLKREGKSEADLKKEYGQWVGASIQDDPNSKRDDYLRNLFTNFWDKIPMDQVMTAITEFQASDSEGGNTISTKRGRYGEPSELERLIRMLESMTQRFEGLPEALKEASTMNIQFKDE